MHPAVRVAHPVRPVTRVAGCRRRRRLALVCCCGNGGWCWRRLSCRRRRRRCRTKFVACLSFHVRTALLSLTVWIRPYVAKPLARPHAITASRRPLRPRAPWAGDAIYRATHVAAGSRLVEGITLGPTAHRLLLYSSTAGHG